MNGKRKNRRIASRRARRALKRSDQCRAPLRLARAGYGKGPKPGAL